MLVIERRVGQGVVINDDIFITVVSLKRQVHICFEAPESIKIFRLELSNAEEQINATH